MRIYEGDGTVASTTGGSLTLEHGLAGGTSSIVFKASNSGTTNDYAYIQYTDNFNNYTNYKWDLSGNYGSPITSGTSIPSTGSSTEYLTTSSISTGIYSVLAPSPHINLPSNLYCISMNQTNVDLDKINYLYTYATVPYSTNITFSCWINPNIVYENANRRHYLFNCFNTGAGGNTCFDIWLDSNQSPNTPGRINVFINNTVFFYTSESVTSGIWSHIAVTFNSITKVPLIYRNSVRMTVIKLDLNSQLVNINPFNRFLIGSRGGYDNINKATDTLLGDNVRGYRGYISYINVFYNTLSDADIMELYTNPTYTPAEKGLMTIGIENDSGYLKSDNIVLWSGAGAGFVGVNTKSPQYTLDVNGNVNATSYNASSDYRLKENIMSLNGTFTVDDLNPVTYNLKSGGKQDIGFIAHEVQEFYPFLVTGKKDGSNNQSLNYNGFIGILTKEIKDLKVKVARQEAKALEQETKISNQDTRIQTLEKMMSDLINK
jgi:hypothetical protein